jgi:hypothetical protein
MEAAPEVQWVQLTQFPTHDIQSAYPFLIRRRDNGRIMSLTPRVGYLIVCIQGKYYYQHRVIAEQFIPNPLNLPQIDHVNQARDDNHIENLRWCDARTNGMNKGRYHTNNCEYVDVIGPNSIQVEHWNDHTFEDIHFDPDGVEFYYFNGKRYRRLQQSTPSGKHFLVVHATDTTGHTRTIPLNKFRRTHNL